MNNRNRKLLHPALGKSSASRNKNAKEVEHIADMSYTNYWFKSQEEHLLINSKKNDTEMEYTTNLGEEHKNKKSYKENMETERVCDESRVNDFLVVICNSEPSDIDPDDSPYIPELDTEDENDISQEIEADDDNIEPLDIKKLTSIKSFGEIDRKVEMPVRKKVRKRHQEPASWVIQRNQKLREQGLSYKGLIKTSSGKLQYAAPRSARHLGPRCNCKLSQLNKCIQCGQISDEDREMCFKEFWRMDWSAKKATVRSLVTRSYPKNKKNQKQIVSRRKQSLQFHIHTRQNDVQKLIRVCKLMFLNTFGLKESTVLNWINSGFEKVILPVE